MRIGVDIGGVVKSLTTEDPIDDAIETLFRLAQNGHSIDFISKCGLNYAQSTLELLAKWKLDCFPIHFCPTYPEKVKIAEKLNIDLMIDDKMVVLKFFENSPINTTCKRIWFNPEQKNIQGVRTHDRAFFDSVTIVYGWSEVEDICSESI